MGWNPLQNTIGQLCREAGFVGYYTNHSLRATAASRLYAKGVDEQLIMERTGHSSMNGVRSYKWTTMSHVQKVSNLMFTSKSPSESLGVSDKENLQPRQEETVPEKKACYQNVAKKTSVQCARMQELGNVQFSGCSVTFNFN